MLTAMLHAFVSGLAAAAPPPPPAPATRDLPIATAATVAPHYLEGADWSATGGGRSWPTGTCSFVTNRDYNPNGDSAKAAAASSHYYMDQAACLTTAGVQHG